MASLRRCAAPNARTPFIVLVIIRRMIGTLIKLMAAYLSRYFPKLYPNTQFVYSFRFIGYSDVVCHESTFKSVLLGLIRAQVGCIVSRPGVNELGFRSLFNLVCGLVNEVTVVCVRAFQVGHSEKCGRYLVASRFIPAGHVIYREMPLVAGPKLLTKPMCLGCYRPVVPSAYR